MRIRVAIVCVERKCIDVFHRVECRELRQKHRHKLVSIGSWLLVFSAIFFGIEWLHSGMLTGAFGAWLTLLADVAEEV
jgi:hypothetical protein